MTERDSFLEEVAEEVRRDRMFALMRRYGWIAILAVLLIVGGAAWNEWRKAQMTERAQATGDAILEAVSLGDPQARAEALAALEPADPGARAVVSMLRAGALAETGADTAAAEALDSVGGADVAPIYGQVAAFKALLQRTGVLSPEERQQGFSQLAAAGGPLRLLAEEQVALTEIETGATEAALERLETIRADADATPGLRRRATQLIVALGGEPQPLADG